MTAPTLTAIDEAAALEQLHELGCTDGLPVVVPTPERVDRMALAMGADPGVALGAMGPNLGECTIERLAACAVMAGCVPDHAAVVVAAAKAVLDPSFDLTEMQATTHATAPLIIVNGPARRGCGVHGGFGALGPGHRANASIGRALRLAMINIGGGRTGTSDMALLGHPGKFTMCLAEDEEVSPFDPLHQARGYSPDQSTVTVMGVDSPQSVIAVTDADDPTCADRMLASFAAAFANVTTNNAALTGGMAALALNPEHAALLARFGYDRSDIQREIHDRAVISNDVLAASAAAGMTRPGTDGVVRCFGSPDDVVVFVAGGGGLYSVAFPTWCAGPHRNRAVTVEIEFGTTCEIPGMAEALGER